MNERDHKGPETGHRMPRPAEPRTRREPLPWQRPKPSAEDPDAPRRVAAILASPSYRQADQDIDFLNRDDVRGVRLELDYFKAEALLAEHGIAHTIVVFGSTRIPEPGAARRHVEELTAAQQARPDDAEIAARLAIAERLLAKSQYYEVARALGRRAAEASEAPHGQRLVVMTGGGPGLMEAANRGAYDAGGRTAGLNITLPHEQYPNPYVTPELCISFHYFAMRKLHFLKRARALVAFPGGYGTFDELFETLTLIQTRKIAPLPVILVGEEYWRRAFDVDFLVAEGTIDPEDRELFWYAETADEIWDDICRWHGTTGRPFVAKVGA